MNPKQRLNEWSQRKRVAPPYYVVHMMPDCPTHAPRWQGTVTVMDEMFTVYDIPGAKRDVEHRLAEAALSYFEQQQVELPPSNHVGNDASCHAQGALEWQPRPTPPFDVHVLVDADHISFCNTALQAQWYTTRFVLYASYGANLPHLRDAMSNTEIEYAPRPGKNVADMMIAIEASRLYHECVDGLEFPVVIVSRDSLLYTLDVLLDNVTFVSTQEQLEQKLRELHNK